jgi:oligoendopeptidase F
VHSILTKDLPLLDFKNLTPEIAELASMSMELMSMDHWDLFFENEEDLRRAKINQLEDVMSTLPWVALIDRFQHWVYEHPEHTVAERDAAWLELHARFSPQATDWSGCEQARTKLWQRQLHLFELPFYYIEYAFAQLGAIAVWRNYRQNPGQALEQYLEGLSLGYTRSINGMYETAGARFDFSPEYIGELIGFVEQEWEALQ